jgi:riboflavin biosynthesis pyrimidine reductase
MIASADGRATVEGRSVKLGHPDDRALLRELRTGVDAVLAGSATLRAERYARLLDPDQRALRAQRGQPEHPVVATVSRQVDLRADEVPLLTEPGVPVQVYAERGGSIAGATADVDVEALGAPLDIRRALRHLRRERGVRSVSCEGGPSLLRQLVEAACLDDLLLTVAPLLVAGDGPTPLSGPALVPPSELELRAVHQADGHLFLHYTL